MIIDSKNNQLSSNRINHLISLEALKGTRVLVIGLGSVGFPTMQNLTMCGVSDWVLVDRDTLDLDNLVKHPGKREEIGKPKTEIAEDWILDRNPEAKVERLDCDITSSEGQSLLRNAISSANVVLCCTDNQNTRLQINRTCLEFSKPCVTGVVYRTGFGGDAFIYEPGASGCYDCFQNQIREVSIGRVLNDSRAITEIEDEIAEEVYGKRSDPKYGLSGLSIDIQMVSMLVARLALPAILGDSINESMLKLFNIGGPKLTRLETNLLWIPYDVRGPSKPPLPEVKTVWLDTNSGNRQGLRPHCGNCLADALPHNIYCHNCGFLLEWKDQEVSASSIEGYGENFQIEELIKQSNDDQTPPKLVTEVVREWKEIPAPREGYGIHHVSVISRRHLIDELFEEDDLGISKTGNAKVATQPFSMVANPILPLRDCVWCSNSEDSQ
jgi:molybdopterin/thiamine biosynthesis adenylyltransferase